MKACAGTDGLLSYARPGSTLNIATILYREWWPFIAGRGRIAVGRKLERALPPTSSCKMTGPTFVLPSRSTFIAA